MTARFQLPEAVNTAADYRDLLEHHALEAATPLRKYFLEAALGVDRLLGMHLRQDFRDASGAPIEPGKAWLEALAPLNLMNEQSLDPHDADARDRWENSLHPAYLNGFKKIIVEIKTPPPPKPPKPPFNPVMRLTCKVLAPPTARFRRNF